MMPTSKSSDLHLLPNEPIEPKKTGKSLDIGGTEIIAYRLVSTDEAIRAALSEIVQGTKNIVSGLLDGERLFMLEPLGEATVCFV